ncbi:hypothetical protein [Pinibacter soli]|uniref:Uncharacterized protein n=1 Tax=Pinibacter soli TaxID=3044211 RepID=A0ABT6RIB0_9BACT|nr:hypothetical protein [Pinibacter soli]MDI3322312.1 hypothetical protein [Pinibacter soli]
MKKINNWMLTNHPLIWNTRFHIMLPLVISLNIIFFFWGYCQNITLKNVSDWSYFAAITIDAVELLIAFLIVLVWLVFYLRHNAFKALLPLSKFYLQREFLIILIVIFGLISPILITKWGVNTKINKLGKSVNIKKERRIISLASHFLPFDLSNFSPRKEYAEDGEIDTAKIEKGMVAGLSYLNFRGRGIYDETEPDYDSLLNEKAISWLKMHRKDSIINCIDKYLQLCRKYGAEYKFNSTAHVNGIFSTPDFIVKEEIPSGKFDSRGMLNSYYIANEYRANGALNTIYFARQGLMPDEYWILSMWTLCLSYLLFSFRVTPIKTWISSIIAGVILTVCTVVGFASGRDENLLTLSPIVVGIVGLSISVVNTFKKRQKFLSGITYLLSLFVSTFFVLAVYSFVYRITRYDHYSTAKKVFTFSDRLHDWLGDNSNSFFITNFVFSLLMMLFVMIPLIKKWRANPEE